jgi:hypothetical protein
MRDSAYYRVRYAIVVPDTIQLGIALFKIIKSHILLNKGLQRDRKGLTGVREQVARWRGTEGRLFRDKSGVAQVRRGP